MTEKNIYFKFSKMSRLHFQTVLPAELALTRERNVPYSPPKQDGGLIYANI